MLGSVKRLALFAALSAAAAVAVIALVAGIVGWHHRQELLIKAHEWIESHILEGSQPPTPDPARYQALSTELEHWRQQLAQRWRAAADRDERAAIEREAQLLLETTLPSLMRCWIGTPWDFNGTAAEPGRGKIACGYFVSTVLRDAGFKVNRYRLAQQPSANIIHTFVDKKHSSLVAGKSYDEFLSILSQREPGIYICGLDTHVAFIVKTSDGFRFIHSSGSKPWAVVDESSDQAGVLQRSNWRMLGNLTASKAAILSWLKGDTVKVVR